MDMIEMPNTASYSHSADEVVFPKCIVDYSRAYDLKSTTYNYFPYSIGIHMLIMLVL